MGVFKPVGAGRHVVTAPETVINPVANLFAADPDAMVPVANPVPCGLALQQVQPALTSESWVATSGGDWSDGGDWSTGTPPTSSTAATIAATAKSRIFEPVQTQ